MEYVINLKQRAKFGDVILAGVFEQQTRRLNASLRSIRAQIKALTSNRGKQYSLKRLTAGNSISTTASWKASTFLPVSPTLYNPETNRTDIKYDVTERQMK